MEPEITGEVHQEQFKGWWVPAYVVKLFQGKKISEAELILLATIDSLGSTEVGCVASNDYLGKVIGQRGDTVSKAISKFKTLGLVEQVYFDGRRRELRTCWSKQPKKSKAASDGGPSQTRATAQGRLGLQPKAHSIIQGDKTKGEGRGPSNGSFLDEDEVSSSPGKPRPTPFQIQCGLDLAKLLRDAGKTPGNKSKETLAEGFRLLQSVDGVTDARLKRVLSWYATCFKKQYTPKAYTSEAFRQKFQSIEDAMIREFGDLLEDEGNETRPPEPAEQLTAEEWEEIEKNL